MNTAIAKANSIVHSAALSDAGRVRETNEDAFIADPNLGLFAVADGMGGHASGEVAAEMAIAALRNAVPRAPDLPFLERSSLANRQLLLEWMNHTVNATNLAIKARTQESANLRGMGCTLDAILLRGGGVFLAHVGDSRVYLRRGGYLSRLTEDHTLGQSLLDSGALTPDEVTRHPQSSMLTRALGPYPTVSVDISYFDVDAGDVFLICSDGLYDEVDHERIGQLLEYPPQRAAELLVEAALTAGGKDNVTAVVFSVRESPLRSAVIGADSTRRALAQSPLFMEFTSNELVRVQKIALSRTADPDEVIYEQGTPHDELAVVIEGQLQVFHDGHRVASLGPGDPCGAISLHSSPILSLTVRAISPVRLLVFPLNAIRTLLATDSVIAAKLASGALSRVTTWLYQAAAVVAGYRAQLVK